MIVGRLALQEDSIHLQGYRFQIEVIPDSTAWYPNRHSVDRYQTFNMCRGGVLSSIPWTSINHSDFFGSSQRSFWLELICAAMQCTCRVFESAHGDMENFSGTYHSAMFVCTQVDSVEFLVRSAISRQSCDCHKSYHTNMSWLLCVKISDKKEKCLRRSWEPVTLIQQTGTSPLFVVSR